MQEDLLPGLPLVEERINILSSDGTLCTEVLDFPSFGAKGCVFILWVGVHIMILTKDDFSSSLCLYFYEWMPMASPGGCEDY